MSHVPSALTRLASSFINISHKSGTFAVSGETTLKYHYHPQIHSLHYFGFTFGVLHSLGSTNLK